MASVRSITQSTTGGQDRPVTLPAGTTDGDLLLWFGTLTPSSTLADLTFSPGWTVLATNNDGVSMDFVMWHRYATGDPPITSHDSSTIRQLAIAMYAVANGGTPVIGALATALSNAPNSPSVTIPGAAGANLFLSYAGVTDNSGVGFAVSSYPVNYNTNTAFPPVVNCSVVVGTRALAATSDDPGAFLLDKAEPWIAWTVGVPDSAAQSHQAIAVRAGPLRRFTRY